MGMDLVGGLDEHDEHGRHRLGGQHGEDMGGGHAGAGEDEVPDSCLCVCLCAYVTAGLSLCVWPSVCLPAFVRLSVPAPASRTAYIHKASQAGRQAGTRRHSHTHDSQLLRVSVARQPCMSPSGTISSCFAALSVLSASVFRIANPIAS